LLSPLLSLGLVLVLMLTGSTAAASWTKAVEGSTDAPTVRSHAASIDGDPFAHDHGPHLRRVDPDPTATMVLESAEPESDDSFEATAATPAPGLVPYSTRFDAPLNAHGADTGRRLVLTGLGRGPPR
jgi:hypothetical protein